MTKKQDKSGSKQSNKLETLGNEVTMNLNNILYQNIQASPYFKQLYELKTYHEVIDEIYNHVESLEPFLKGTTASTAFCLLYKLWTLRLTVKQVSGLIEHPDSPYIRALGFLYLRYVCKPENLWEWFEAYLDDEEELQVQGGARPIIMTIGKICSQLLTEQKWLGTILPRIPVPIARDIDQRLKEFSSQDLPQPQPPQPSSLLRRDSYDLESRPSDRNISRRGGEDEEREYSNRRSRTRSRSIEQGGGSSRSHRYRDHDYDRGRRDHDRYRGDRERKRSRSDSRDRHHHHRRHRSSSRDNKERDHDSGKRSSGHDYDRNKRRYDDERNYERRRSRSPKN